MKRKYGLSFWDAYFIAAQEHQADIEVVFCAALLHDKASSRLQRVQSKDASSLRQVEREMNPKQMLAFSSIVELRNGEMRHIPMLDFHCAASASGLRLAISALRALTEERRGLLLESGKSYHYYGFQLLTDKELATFLARAILLGHIVDRRWIAHQMIERACALRIGSGHGYESLPFVVAEISSGVPYHLHSRPGF